VGTSNRLGAALDAQFAIDVVDVAFHRADGDDELPRCLVPLRAVKDPL
jgi:hypothetical protein